MVIHRRSRSINENIDNKSGLEKNLNLDLARVSRGGFVPKEKTRRHGKVPPMYVHGHGGGYDEGPMKQKNLLQSNHSPIKSYYKGETLLPSKLLSNPRLKILWIKHAFSYLNKTQLTNCYP